MTEALTPEQKRVRRYLNRPTVRYTFVLLQNYLQYSLPARSDALLRVFQDTRERFKRGDGRLAANDVWPWIELVSEAMLLLSDVGALLFACDGKPESIGRRLHGVRSQDVRRTFRTCLTSELSDLIVRAWPFPTLDGLSAAYDNLTAEDLDVVREGIDSTTADAGRSLKAFARLFFHHEEVFHRVKHSPASVLTNLREFTDGSQGAAVVTDPNLLSGNKDIKGLKFLPISQDLLEAWAHACEDANALLQVLIQNHLLKLQMGGPMILPIRIVTNDEGLKARYVQVRDKTHAPKSLADLTINLQVSGQRTPGGWFDTTTSLWERLRKDSWPFDAQYVEQPVPASLGWLARIASAIRSLGR